VDNYFLTKQLGASVKMIQKHYGHTNPVMNAEGLPGWESIASVPQVTAQSGRVNAGAAKGRPVEAYGGAVTLSEPQRWILGIEFDARRGRLADTQCAAGALDWAKKQSGRIGPATSFHIPHTLIAKIQSTGSSEMRSIGLIYPLNGATRT
jgi:hypothetical protein